MQIKLPESLKVNDLEAFKNSINIDACKDILEINPEKINSIDTTGMQCLLALVKKITDLGFEVKWTENNSLIYEISKNMGIEELLKIEIKN